VGLPVVVSAERLLITGCSGFIGRALSRRCLAERRAVTGAVRSASKSAGLPEGVAGVIVPEVGPHTDWHAALEGVTEIVHLAARVHALHDSGRNAQEDFFRINIAGTARLARAAAEAGIRRMVFLSTIKVHGEGGQTTYSETDPEAPQGPYAVSKQEAETVLREISRRSRLETVVLRSPLVYGPGVGANFLRLIRLVERRVPLPIASVSNRRSLIFVENLVDAILACLRAEKAAGRTYLVADAESPSTPQLISQIAALLGVAPRLFAFPPLLLRLAGSLAGKEKEAGRLLGSLAADTSRIQQELKWRPRFSLAEGLAATIAWYRGTGPDGRLAGAFK
jgi:nucleoside-diphosphate-sugar epimerase